jgi:hypothetical protein
MLAKLMSAALIVALVGYVGVSMSHDGGRCCNMPTTATAVDPTPVQCSPSMSEPEACPMSAAAVEPSCCKTACPLCPAEKEATPK